MTLEEVRTLALSLPEVTEQPHFEKVSFRVRGGIFATVPVEGTHLHILLDERQARDAVADAPTAFQELWWGKRVVGVRVDLAAAETDHVLAFLEEAWRRKAPKGLVKRLDES